MNTWFYSGLDPSEIDRFEETLRRILANVAAAEESLDRDDR
jgi:hypothetical protein